MPTNIVLDLIRTRRGLKWGVPVALVLAPTYLFAASVVATVVKQGGPGWLNVLVLLFAWNAMKFAWMGLLVVVLLVRAVHRSATWRRSCRNLDGRLHPDRLRLAYGSLSGQSGRKRQVLHS